MDIIKIIVVALTSVCISLIIKQYRPEFSLYISIITSCLILFCVFQRIEIIIDLIRNLTNHIDINISFFTILLKITGIAYLVEFAGNLCRDAGETAVASKVEFAGRILIISISIPIFSALLETMIQLID